MNCLHEISQREVTNVNQARIQSLLRSIIVGVKAASGPAVATPVLVVTLIGRNKREPRYMARSEIFEQAMCSLESYNIGQAQSGAFTTLLHTSKVHKRVVLGGVQFQQTGQSGRHGIDVGIVSEKAVAVSDIIGAGRRQALLIAFPAMPLSRQLICDRLASHVGCRRNQTPVDVDFPCSRVAWRRRVRAFVGRIGRWRLGIGPGAGDWANWSTASRAIQVRRGWSSDIGCTAQVVKVRWVVTAYAEVRSADHLQVIRRTRVTDREVIDSRISSLCQLVGEGCVRIVHDLA